MNCPGGFEKENTKDTRSIKASFAALRYWNRVTGWQHSLGYVYVMTHLPKPMFQIEHYLFIQQYRQ